EVYERHPDPRRALPAEGGSSVNLAISSRGQHQLDQLGLGQALFALSAPAEGRQVHGTDGATEFERYGRDGQALHFVLRADLTAMLLVRAEAAPGVRLHFDARCTAVDASGPALHVQHGDGRTETVLADAVVAADGAHSTVRR